MVLLRLECMNKLSIIIHLLVGMAMSKQALNEMPYFIAVKHSKMYSEAKQIRRYCTNNKRIVC